MKLILVKHSPCDPVIDVLRPKHNYFFCLSWDCLDVFSPSEQHGQHGKRKYGRVFLKSYSDIKFKNYLLCICLPFNKLIHSYPLLLSMQHNFKKHEGFLYKQTYVFKNGIHYGIYTLQQKVAHYQWLVTLYKPQYFLYWINICGKIVYYALQKSLRHFQQQFYLQNSSNKILLPWDIPLISNVMKR